MAATDGCIASLWPHPETLALAPVTSTKFWGGSFTALILGPNLKRGFTCTWVKISWGSCYLPESGRGWMGGGEDSNLFFEFHIVINSEWGTAVAQCLRCCATYQKVAGSIPARVMGNFHWHKIFWSHYGLGVDSVSNRNEYQQHFLGGKGGLCVRLTTLPPSCAVVMKSRNINFLETSGSLQACNGTALLLIDSG